MTWSHATGSWRARRRKDRRPHTRNNADRRIRGACRRTAAVPHSRSTSAADRPGGAKLVLFRYRLARSGSASVEVLLDLLDIEPHAPAVGAPVDGDTMTGLLLHCRCALWAIHRVADPSPNDCTRTGSRCSDVCPPIPASCQSSGVCFGTMFSRTVPSSHSQIFVTPPMLPP